MSSPAVKRLCTSAGKYIEGSPKLHGLGSGAEGPATLSGADDDLILEEDEEDLDAVD